MNKNITGLTKVTVQVQNLSKSKKGYESEFLVDIGAIDCMAPASALRKAGISPEGRRVYELANGEPTEWEYGFARISFLGHETVSQIIFGPEKADPILGVVALENVNIGVDPATGKLKSYPASSLKRVLHLK
ncbi:MAG: clan AA aspartic protease [Bacteroidota bacterium]|nr:clan AA aspartic protease [Bacteroidota bacterium]